ncbi:DUF3828 domain-containing protein [Mucilaginibacter aquariorum]|uniref:YbjP/YqhG family protein n=1 Tax=Mucilaginibacter aquariorum TaxID=2967225 RepID=A0ABT1TAC6_9SPHI|nr:DUF3828 domain-containing protein [Mucilaginibacter aquariorum]MCQ6961557.1 YbjP/YqhG family protein [Mucilaginibacter aquariorum]
MSKRYFIILGIVILSIAVSSNIKAQSPIKDKESARAFVQKFYSWYVALYNKDTPKSDLVALKKYPTYFDTALSDAIMRDYSEQPKNAGEILGLDADPFLSAQDTGFDYQAGDVKQVGDKFLIDIHSGTAGEPKKEILKSETILIAQVANVNNQWKFINFLYPAKQGGGSLLTVLAKLLKDRKEWNAKQGKKSKAKQ